MVSAMLSRVVCALVVGSVSAGSWWTESCSCGITIWDKSCWNLEEIIEYCGPTSQSYWCLGGEVADGSACAAFKAKCEAHSENPTFYENSDSCEPDLTCNYAVVSPAPALLDAGACYCDGLTLGGTVNPMLEDIMNYPAGGENCWSSSYWCLPNPDSNGLA